MRTKKMMFCVLLVCCTTPVVISPAMADDLNPLEYRGLPLSVYAHWSLDSNNQLALIESGWVDDNDPSTYMHNQPFFYGFGTHGEPEHFFVIPNIVDELPVKYMRVQIAWQGTTEPPINIEGFANGVMENYIPGTHGQVVFASIPLVFTQPDGGYQYFDIEFYPNPDWEIITIALSQNAELVQVVIDSISTVPEPATVVLLALGGAMIRYRIKKTT